MVVVMPTIVVRPRVAGLDLFLSLWTARFGGQRVWTKLASADDL